MIMIMIDAALHQSKHASTPHPTFTVDGAPLNVWLHQVAPEHDVLGLVPAQGWLINDDEFELAWRRLTPAEPNSATIVPILICSDDIDLACSVVVVEQYVQGTHIVWARFGYSLSGGIETGVSVRWFANIPPLEFELEAFHRALSRFKHLAKHDWH